MKIYTLEGKTTTQCTHQNVTEQGWSGIQDNYQPAGGITFTCKDCGLWWTDDDEDPREKMPC